MQNKYKYSYNWLLAASGHSFSFKTLVIIWKSQEESLTDFCYTIDGIVHTNFFFSNRHSFFRCKLVNFVFDFLFWFRLFDVQTLQTMKQNFRFVTLKNLELPFGKIKECYNYVSSEHEPFLCYSVVFHFKHSFFLLLLCIDLPNLAQCV